jgi:hypothetical protein
VKLKRGGDEGEPNENMKRTHVRVLIFVALACITMLYTSVGEEQSFTLARSRVQNVLELYKVITKCELIVASNVRLAVGTVTLQSPKRSSEDSARLLEEALLKQAGVIITQLDAKRVSVTYNDQMPINSN